MLAKFEEFGKHDVRCLINDREPFISIFDFEKATNFSIRSKIGVLARQETLLAKYDDLDVPREIFKRPTCLRFVSLSCLKECIKSSFYAPETKQKVLNWLESIQSKEISTQPSVLEFDYEQSKIRSMVDEKGDPWFVAKDVCSVLGIGNPSQTISYLDADEQTIIGNDSSCKMSGLRRDTRLVNESGLYELIFNSRKPEAKQFKKWVTHEVLPQIRKKGYYSVTSSDNQTQLDELFNQVTELTEGIKQIKKQLNKQNKRTEIEIFAPKTHDERIAHKIEENKAHEYTRVFKGLMERKFGLTQNHKNDWSDIWDEINFQSTGWDNAQLKAMRNIPDTYAGVRKLFTTVELQELCNVLEYIIDRLETTARQSKTKATKTIANFCRDYQQEIKEEKQ